MKAISLEERWKKFNALFGEFSPIVHTLDEMFGRGEISQRWIDCPPSMTPDDASKLIKLVDELRKVDVITDEGQGRPEQTRIAGEIEAVLAEICAR